MHQTGGRFLRSDGITRHRDGRGGIGVAEQDRERQQPPTLGGFRVLLAGGAALAILMVALRPIMDPKDCPNYGAAGNASAFADPMWDLYLPFVLLGWVVLVVAEQAHPVTWWHRTRTVVAVRAASAVSLALVASCCLGVPMLTICR